MKTNKTNKLVALMLSSAMAMTAFAADVHAEEQAATKAWKIGDTAYDTLQEAVDAVGNDATEITMVTDASGNGVKVTAGKKITINFGSHTYTIDGTLVGSTGTESQAFQLLKGADVTLKNGTITSEKAKMLVQNYSNLTLQGMHLDGSKLQKSNPVYTLSNNCGNVVISDTTITAKAGGYAFDVFYWPSKGYTDGVSVSVEGNSVINGDIEYDSDGSADGKLNVAEKAKLNIKSGSFSGAFVTSGLNDDKKTGIQISGGTFTTKPDEAFLADGVEFDENGTVIKSQTPEEKALNALKEAVKAADAKYDDTVVYNKERKSAFDTAVTEAKELLKSVENGTAATAAELNAAAEKLTKATENLTAATLKEQLAYKIEEAEGLSEATYTPATWAELEAALTAAKAIADDAEDAAVTEALNALNTAMDNLKEAETPTLDFTVLEAAIQSAEESVKNAEGIYTQESIEALKLAITTAKNTLNTATTQQAITDAVKALSDVKLVKIENKPGVEDPAEKVEITDKETGITVSAAAGVLDSDVELIVNPITDEDVNDKVADALNSLTGNYTAFDIKLMKDNAAYEFNGSVTVTMDIPEDFYSRLYSLYHIDENGKITPMAYGTTDDKLSFTVTHFSIYVLVDEGAKEVTPNKPIVKPNEKPAEKPATDNNAAIKDTATKAPNTGDTTTAMTYVMLLVCAGAYLGYAYKRKGNKA